MKNKLKSILDKFFIAKCNYNCADVDEFEKLESKYNNLQFEHEQLQADYSELSNKYNNIINTTKKRKGRPKKEVCATAEEIKARMQQGETAEQIAEDLGISRMTLFRRLKES